MTAKARVQRFGSGPRRALAIHCTLGHSGAWRGVASALAADLTLWAVDLPGHGRSPDHEPSADFHQACTDLTAPFLTGGTDLIGHSFGATVALRLAVEHPEKLRSLTLIEPVYFAVLAADNPQALADFDVASAPYAEALRGSDPAQAARLFNRFWGDGRPWADTPDTTRTYMTDRIHFVPRQSPMIFEDNSELMRSGRLANVTAPVLLMRGSDSPEVTLHVNDALAGRLPHVRSVTIPGAGHMAPVTHAKKVAAEILDHLKMA